MVPSPQLWCLRTAHLAGQHRQVGSGWQGSAMRGLQSLLVAWQLLWLVQTLWLQLQLSQLSEQLQAQVRLAQPGPTLVIPARPAACRSCCTHVR